MSDDEGVGPHGLEWHTHHGFGGYNKSDVDTVLAELDAYIVALEDAVVDGPSYGFWSDVNIRVRDRGKK